MLVTQSLLTLVLVAFGCRASAAAPTYYDPQRSKEGSNPLVDARVAELDFTGPWFARPPNRDVTGSYSCPVPKKHEQSLAFGIGYESVEKEARIASCWVRELHKTAGNLDSSYMSRAELVQAAGVSELLVASIISLADRHATFGSDGGKPVVTAHAAPFYAVLKMVAKSSVLRHLVEWSDPSDVLSGKHKGRPLIVVAIVPGNPLGNIERGLLNTCESTGADERTWCSDSPTYVITDHSFLWPCLVEPSSRHGNNTTNDEWTAHWPLIPSRSTVQLFGLSKATGHAGIRYGWAWTTDAAFAKSLRRTLWELGLGLSAAGVAQATRIMAAVAMRGSAFHDWCAAEMETRWDEILRVPAFANGLSSKSPCFRVLSRRMAATAIIECNTTQTCAEVLRSVGIASTPGTAFGAGSNTARISMGSEAEVFFSLLQRLHSLPDDACHATPPQDSKVLEGNS